MGHLFAPVASCSDGAYPPEDRAYPSAMPASTVKRNFRTGVLHAIPFLLVVAPFAMLFGVVATEAGLPLLETMAMTSLVIAGASQFTALQLMSDGAGVAMAAATALAVNMRMAMFSAALTPQPASVVLVALWVRAALVSGRAKSPAPSLLGELQELVKNRDQGERRGWHGGTF